MKIYSDTLTSEDIRRTFHEVMPASAYMDEFHAEGLATRGKVAGKMRWTIYAGDSNGKRARNGRDGYALTYEDYGRWFALLFQIDPNAWISGWEGEAQFHALTKGQFQVAA